MVEIKEVTSKKMMKEFVEFPLNLYKNNPYFVPPIYIDELNLIKKNAPANKICDQVFYLCYKDEKIAGRIQGIIQKQYNEIHNEKRVRFSRFDSIDDFEVSRALFNAVETWAKNKGMDTACGPLGYNDLEREGLLIEGFNELSTFEEQYNYDYYQKLIEDAGYTKEVDWVESRITLNKDHVEKIKRLSDNVMNRYHLHIVGKKRFESKWHYVDRIAPIFFDLLDEGYKKLYGVVPITEDMKKSLINEFKLLIDTKYIFIIENDKNIPVVFGLCFPAIGEALQKSGGRITIPALLRLLKAFKHPKGLDLALTAVNTNFLNTGVNVPVMEMIMNLLNSGKIQYLETNLNLEDNTKIRSFWKYFNERQHKRRRSFIKHL